MASTLKVNTIQGASNTTTTIKTNGGTDALTIDTTGRILQPAKPHFYIRGNAGWKDHGDTLTTYFGSSNAAVEVISNVGSHFNSTTGVFTVPVTGIYQFNIVMYVNETGDVSNYYVIYKNGAHLNNNFNIYRNTDTDYPDHSVSSSISVPLSATDTIELKVAQDVYGHHSYFTGYLLG